MAREADTYADQLLHYGHLLAQAQHPTRHPGERLAVELDQARERLQARAGAAAGLEAPPAAIPLDAGGDRPGAAPGALCPCARCTGRRLVELAARCQERLDAIAPPCASAPSAPPPAPADDDAAARCQAPSCWAELDHAPPCPDCPWRR